MSRHQGAIPAPQWPNRRQMAYLARATFSCSSQGRFWGLSARSRRLRQSAAKRMPRLLAKRGIVRNSPRLLNLESKSPTAH